MREPYDAVLLIAFGGPDRMDDVRPFLANVLRGRPASPDRIEEVVRHYELIGGRSPLNELTFRQARALQQVLESEGRVLPVYVGMRNWHPYFHETLADMQQCGVRRAIGFILAAQQSDASCGRYQRELAVALRALGRAGPRIDFVDSWHAHPLFICAVAERVRDAFSSIPPERRGATRVVFTAHSIPTAMAAESPYVAQLTDSARLVAAQAGSEQYRLAYQSRSGNLSEPWLEPDIDEVVRDEARRGTRDLLVVPLGFLCDHVEVLYDLDIKARKIADAVGVNFVRAQTVNDHPAFVRMMAAVIRQHERAAASQAVPTAPARPGRK